MSEPRGMKVQAVRFGVIQWELIREEAAMEGVSASQFIRDAAFLRAMFHRARRNADEGAMIARLYELAREDKGMEAVLGHFSPPSEGLDEPSRDGRPPRRKPARQT